MACISWRYFILLLFSVELTYCYLTEAQIKATQKLIRRTCKTKAKITNEEELDRLPKGNWDDVSHTSRCYLHCCLSMLKVINSDGFIDLEAGMRQSAILPPERRASSEIAIDTCKDKGEGLTDKCDIAYEIAKCLYDFEPKFYLIP
uniref:Odorant binding protein 4 n=1 Tax=Anomala corpulenta TaxID=931571 RepID=A0A0E3Y5Z9_9SCAR|nr:odorant binding protein 4 [Anomala corpulenta]